MKKWMSLVVIAALGWGGCGDDGGGDDTDVTPADMGGGGGFAPPPADLPEASLGEGGVGGTMAETTSPADFACLDTRTAPPESGTEKTFTLSVEEFQTGDTFEGLCVKFFADNMVDLSADCDPATDLVTDASGTVSVTDFEDSWYAYRVFPLEQGTASRNIQDSIQINEQVPAGDTAVANSVSEATLNLIPAVLGFSSAPDTALVAGTVQDCNEDAVYGAIVRMYDSAGDPILEQASRTAPKYRYFDGDNFPSADQPWTHIDGLYAAANVPAPAAGSTVFVEIWGEQAGEFVVIGCEEVPVLPNAISIVNVGPLRADGPTCPGMM